MAEPEQSGVVLKLIGESRPASARVIAPDPVRTCVIEECIKQLCKCSTGHLIAWLPIFGKYADENSDG